MNPFKTIGRWLWRWWNGLERNADVLAWERSKYPRREFVIEELVKSPPDVIAKTQSLFERQLDAAIRECILGPDDTLNVVTGDTKPSDGSEFLEVMQKLRGGVLIVQEPTDCSNATFSVKINHSPLADGSVELTVDDKVVQREEFGSYVTQGGHR